MPEAAEDSIVRGPKKSFLINQGFTRSELEIYKSYSEMEIIEFTEKESEDKLSQIPKEPGKFRHFFLAYCVKTILKLVFACFWLPDGLPPPLLDRKLPGVLIIWFHQTSKGMLSKRVYFTLL